MPITPKTTSYETVRGLDMFLSSALKREIFRKLIHLSSLWMVAVIAYTDRPTAIIFFSLLLIGFVGFEYLRMGTTPLAKFIVRYFSIVMRDREHHEKFNFRALTGSFYFILAVLLAVAFFDKTTAITGILVMILSDTTAAIVGVAIGKNKFIVDGKTIEGSAAFFITIAIILFYMTPMTFVGILFIAGAITLIEALSERLYINDNLSIVISVCALLSLPFF